MLLAINANNTNMKFGVFDRGEERGAWRIATDARRTGDEYMVWLSQLMEIAELDPRALDDVIIASVVPAAMFELKALCRSLGVERPLVLGEPGVKLGTTPKVDRPEEVGADRLLNTVAAHDRYGGPAVVVDLGTATTFDVVDHEGNYRGGAIAPGINLSIEALRAAAALLPRTAIQRPARVIGTTTVACLQSGIFWGYVGLVEGLIERIRAEYGQPMKVIATGGLASIFAGATEVFEHFDDRLSMHGLVLIHRLNRAP
jgi:type III pantothenate kinase